MRVIPDSDPPAIRRAKRRRWAYLSLFALFITLALLGVLWVGVHINRINPVALVGVEADRAGAEAHWLAELPPADWLAGHFEASLSDPAFLVALRSPAQALVFPPEDQATSQGWVINLSRKRPAPAGLSVWQDTLSQRSAVRDASGDIVSAGRITRLRIVLGQDFQEIDAILARLESPAPPAFSLMMEDIRPDAALQYEGTARLLADDWRTKLEQALGAEFPPHHRIIAWWPRKDQESMRLELDEVPEGMRHRLGMYADPPANDEQSGVFILLRYAPPLGDIDGVDPMVEEVRWLTKSNTPASHD